MVTNSTLGIAQQQLALACVERLVPFNQKLHHDRAKFRFDLLARELVEQAIAQLDYVPDSIARSLRSRRTGAIGVIAIGGWEKTAVGTDS